MIVLVLNRIEYCSNFDWIRNFEYWFKISNIRTALDFMCSHDDVSIVVKYLDTKASVSIFNFRMDRQQ